jgi:radical SAM protein with 4Fe4S-binding SPASM domain
MLELKQHLKNISEKLDINEINEIDYFARYLEIEAYDGCNFDCIMCPLGKSIYKGGGGISLQLFDKIVSEISEYKDWIKLVCLSRNGEPLLNKNITTMVKKLKEAGIKRVNFSTNASALTEKKSHDLLKAGLDEIRFSIDGYTKETFENVRKGSKFENVLRNCLNFIRIRDKFKFKTQIQIRFVEQKKNEHELKLWRDFWLSKLQKTDVVASKKLHSWGNEIENGQSFKFEREIDSSLNEPCISPFSTLEILYDGTVPLCGCDYKPTVNLGNVKNNSLKNIWNSEKFKKVRDQHASGNRNEIPICVGCEIWDTKIKSVHYNKKKIFD